MNLPTPEKEGYTFSSWNTKADGTGTKVKNKGDIKALLPEDGETIVVLYAQWKKK